jgi:hypothetical protein
VQHIVTSAGGDNGTRKMEHVGKSQPVLVMINPMISLRTRNNSAGVCHARRGCDQRVSSYVIIPPFLVSPPV